MPRSRGSRSGSTRDSSATLGFEAKLLQAADALRNNMDAAEYKHVVLGLIFLKYISDAFEARYEFLLTAVDDPKDEYFLRPSPLSPLRTIHRSCHCKRHLRNGAGTVYRTAYLHFQLVICGGEERAESCDQPR